jgi:MoCo/4Fe-4S cofactor protein with predicted Tat translocation signal
MTIERENLLNLAAIREKLAAAPGGTTWRSLEELAENEEFIRALEDEFPQETRAAQGMQRREFLKLMAASLGLAGLTACMPQPTEQIMPYVQPPDGLVPGNSLYYASVHELGGYARGVVVQSREGRPIKIEGNPDHPASLGRTDAFMQASILELYDPQRTQVITNRGRISTRQAFHAALSQALSVERARAGSGLRLLTQTVTSPTLAFQIEELLDSFPNASWHQYEPVGQDNALAGAEQAFGEAVDTHYSFEQAAVIVSIDNDFILREPGNLRYIREFSLRRGGLPGAAVANRLYTVESSFTNTGAISDHRLPLAPSQIEAFTALLATAVGVEGVGEHTLQNNAIPPGWIEGLAEDLLSNSGASIITCGEKQPAQVHAMVHAMNQVLGNVGRTVIYTDMVRFNPVNQLESLSELARDLEAGSVSLLVILGGNPAFCAPADLNFAALVEQAELSVYLSLFEDETSALVDWHIPGTHYLEMWSDLRAYDGTVSIVQPLIHPLYSGLSPHELLEELLSRPGTSGYSVVRNFWQGALGDGEAEFEKTWLQFLHDGLVPRTVSESRQVQLLQGWHKAVDSYPGGDYMVSRQAQPESAGLEVVFEPDPSIWDGRYANNAWLQELPRPFTKITWDNAALISPVDAERLQVQNLDVVELHYQDRSINAPIWVLPGQPANTVTIHLGHGRRRTGRDFPRTGFNGYALRSSNAPWFGQGMEIRPTGNLYKLANTQTHYVMEGRDLVLRGTLQQFEQNPDFLHTDEHAGEPPPSLYPEFPYEGHAWGMSINLSACVGCNACVVACQAENNIPVVGKDQVLNSREMHWLRIDNYFEGDLDNPKVHFMPVLCVHCEKAPCEPVCPVAATVHSAEGINEMVYNRCIGTRYCSNNCPYKVRRFNFLQYSENTIPLQMVNNPEVTVRSRGVMEKCTYCVQRLNKARIQAKKEGRRVRDGEVMTACQQACPADAIIFGDINDPESLVAQRKELPHDYSLLGHLGTQPRTTYLARLTNPNELIAGDEEATTHG